MENLTNPDQVRQAVDDEAVTVASPAEEKPGWKVKSTKRPSYPRFALPELRADLAAVNALPEFAGAVISGFMTDPALLLRKVEVYSLWMTKHGAHPPTSAKGYVHVPSVMKRLGHGGVDAPTTVRTAILALRETHGLWATNGRHNPECEIDRDLDRYEGEIKERGWGPPRSAADPTKPCRIGSAREMEVRVIDLDHTCMKRLRMIMANERKPGAIYYPTADDPSPSGNMKRNLAVPGLLRRGLAAYVDGLPADPLDPNAIDIISVARDCRVSVMDITRFSENLALVQAARGDRPLVPNPALAVRRYTYADLLGHGREERRENPGGNASPGQASRTSVRALKVFLGTSHAGGSLTSLVPHDFKERVERALRDRPADAPRGWTTEMRSWIKWNAGLRASKPLPKPFGLACRILCLEAGITVGDLVKAADGSGVVRQWLAGETVPSLPQEPVLNKLENTLGIDTGDLSGMLSEEWRMRRFDADLFELEGDDGDVVKRNKRRQRHTRHLPLSFAEMSDDERMEILADQHWAIVNQDTEFARHQAEVSRDHYRLKKVLWPDAMKSAWDSIIPKPRKSVLRRPGEVIPPQPVDANGKKEKRRKDEWRKKTIEHREELLSSILGYWTRDRTLSEEYLEGFQARKIDYTPEAGLGIPSKFLHPVLFVFPDLMSVFCHWRSRRSGVESRGMANMLQLASDFLRPETGPVWKDTEGMKEHLKAFKEYWDKTPHDTPEGPVVLDIDEFLKPGNWRVAVEAAYRILREDLMRVINGKLPKSRDPFLTVDVFVSHPKPLEHYMKGVRVLLDSKPHVVLSQHVHNRRKLQTLILVQTGLRTATMMLRVGGKNPELRKVEDEDGVVFWKIEIAAERFKNFDSPFFSGGNPYQFTLEDEDGLYDLLDEYMDWSRPYMLRGRKSDALFVNSTGTDMSEDQMRQDYHTITRLYFIKNDRTGTGAVEGAVAHGMHAVRHVIATHMVKATGDMRLAAFAIQDTVKVAERYYARFWPMDKLRHVIPVLKRARMVGSRAA